MLDPNVSHDRHAGRAEAFALAAKWVYETPAHSLGHLHDMLAAEAQSEATASIHPDVAMPERP